MSEAEWGGCVQDGGVVAMSDGSVEFKGGSIARSSVMPILVGFFACRMECHGVRCTLHRVRYVLQLVLRTVQVRLVMHGVRTCCIVVFHVACFSCMPHGFATGGVVHVALG